MALSSSDQTLLTLMLVLNSLKQSLGEKTRTRLYDIGEQIELASDLDDWEVIQEGLIDIISNDLLLNGQFEEILAKLNALDSDREYQLMPTQEELTQTFALNKELEIRHYEIELKPDRESREIANLVGKVIKSDRPSEMTRQSGFSEWLNRIKKLL